MPEKSKKRILVLCTHNSSRSQMAEAALRRRFGGSAEVFSAGTEPRGVHPLALRAMAEAGYDLSAHTSDLLDKYLEVPFDYVITVCDSAAEACPVFPGGETRLHVPFPDPSAAQGSEAERLAAFRRVRDAILEWAEKLEIG